MTTTRIPQTAEDVARAVDVMGGIGHISGFTDEAQARRRAADLIRAQAELIDALGELVAAQEKYMASQRTGRMAGSTIDKLTAAKARVATLVS